MSSYEKGVLIMSNTALVRSNPRQLIFQVIYFIQWNLSSITNLRQVMANLNSGKSQRTVRQIKSNKYSIKFTIPIMKVCKK